MAEYTVVEPEQQQPKPTTGPHPYVFHLRDWIWYAVKGAPGKRAAVIVGTTVVLVRADSGELYAGVARMNPKDRHWNRKTGRELATSRAFENMAAKRSLIVDVLGKPILAPERPWGPALRAVATDVSLAAEGLLRTSHTQARQFSDVKMYVVCGERMLSLEKPDYTTATPVAVI